MMTRTQKIRRISHATRRPAHARPSPERPRRPLRAQAMPPATRRGLAPLRRPAEPAKPRRRAPHLRLVVVNARPLRSFAAAAPPALRLVRGFAPVGLAKPRAARPPARKRNAPAATRAGQLVFVLTMAAVGLAALATSVGQILSQRM